MSDATVSFEQFCDDLGPARIAHVYDPPSGMRGILVVDNVATGPAIGGIRMAVDVTTGEVFRLARAMTLKNAAAGLAHGGGKSGILADPHAADKEPLLRAFARAIRASTDYIPGPDMGTDECCMAWVRDEIGRAVGLPRELGGIPLDELGATGFGLAQCAEPAAAALGLELDGATMAIEGFGNVGQHAARCLGQLGVRLVAASDSRGAVHDPDGLAIEALAAIKARGGSVVDYREAEPLPRDDLVGVACDILVPAARPDTIHAGNVDGVRAGLILQGANIPITAEAEAALHDRGVLCIPDFIANAGGVICAAVEYHGGSETTAFEQIAQRIRRNTEEVLARSRDQGVAPRQAAVEMAQARVRRAMSFQRR